MEGKVCQPFIKTVKAFLAQDAVSNVFSHFLRVVSSSRTINWLLDADRAVVSDWAYFSFDSTILAVVPWLAILALFDLAGTWLESKHAVRTILRFWYASTTIVSLGACVSLRSVDRGWRVSSCNTYVACVTIINYSSSNAELFILAGVTVIWCLEDPRLGDVMIHPIGTKPAIGWIPITVVEEITVEDQASDTLLTVFAWLAGPCALVQV